jgi:uncharacterized cupin superfamily protein
MSLRLLAASSLAIALGCQSAPAGGPAAADPPVAEAAQAVSGTGVDYYRVGAHVDDSDFVDVTAQIPALGGTVLEGNPRILVRFDAPPDGVTAHGVFEQRGQARIRIVFPFDEHIQVIDGVLKITDSAGNELYLLPGDSYFIAQGTTITWQVLTPVFQKSFFDYTHPAG